MTTVSDITNLVFDEDERPEGYWSTLIERRDNGIALLQREHPIWLSRMNTDGLDLSDPHACVFGQAFMERNFNTGNLTGAESGYSKGYDLFAATVPGFNAEDCGIVSSEEWSWYSAFGQDEPDDSNCVSSEQEYEDLTRVWVEAINALRAGTYVPGK